MPLAVQPIPKLRTAEDSPKDPGMKPFNDFFGDLNWVYLNVSHKIVEVARRSRISGETKSAIEVKLSFYDKEKTLPYDFKLYYIKDKTDTPGLRIEVSLVNGKQKFSVLQQSTLSKYEIALVNHETGLRTEYKKFSVVKPSTNASKKAVVDLFLTNDLVEISKRLEAALECRKVPDFQEEYPGHNFAFSPAIRHSKSKLFIKSTE